MSERLLDIVAGMIVGAVLTALFFIMVIHAVCKI